MPAMPEGVEDGIVRGLYRYRAAPADARRAPRADPRQRHRRCSRALDAQRMLAEDYDVAAEVWSATCYKLLREDALERRAVEPAAPHRAAAHAVRHRAARATARARSSRSPTS